MAGWNANFDLVWIVSYAEKLITLFFCSCDAFLAPFQRWFASAYTFRTLFDNFRTDRPRRLSAATTRITCRHYVDSPRSIRGLSASVHAAIRGSPRRTTTEFCGKVKFSVSRTVPCASSFAKMLSVLGSSVCIIQLPQRLLGSHQPHMHCHHWWCVSVLEQPPTPICSA